MPAGIAAMAEFKCLLPAGSHTSHPDAGCASNFLVQKGSARGAGIEPHCEAGSGLTSVSSTEDFKGKEVRARGLGTCLSIQTTAALQRLPASSSTASQM